MSSNPEDQGGVRILDAGEAGIKRDSILELYPVRIFKASGWIGLQQGIIVWMSIGKLDREELEKYWDGPVEKGKLSPISESTLHEAAKGETALDLCPLGTPFQRKVWKRLTCIPFSMTTTYGEIAREIGSSGHARAVGSAVGANPIAWLIPCHRVLPANGETGAYRWGTRIKRMLLDNEQEIDPAAGTTPMAEGKEKLEAMLLKAQRFEDIAKLAGDIAHDLNNLLAPIGMATQLLKRKLEDESLDRYVDIIETSTGRARAVIQEILSFSRETETGDLETIPAHSILKEMEKIIGETFPKRIRTRFSYSSSTPALRMDPTQLHRAILNILINARDAIDGKGEIQVRESTHDLRMEVSIGERRLLPGKYVCISVSDTGHGIPDDIRDQIFDPFFTTKPKDEGTGLGLASVYGIIARAGGFIDLESTPGKGSTFHIFLPQAQTDS